MPNQITATGLELLTQNELITIYSDGMKAIYGADINLDQDTPDGQQMMLIIQMITDITDLLREVYNSFDPDQAIGVTLDKRIGYNGIQRQSGTYTVSPISITVDRALTLDGLDNVDEDQAYTVEDDAGNKWLLLASYAYVAAATTSLSFRAEFQGEVLTTLNTITNPSSVILGVVTINNPVTYTTLGVDEESDFDVRLRRGKSVSKASQGYLASLRAELENVENIDEVKTYENNTHVTDSNGVPPHSIWVIVSGTATDEDIATAIYKKRSAGCNMHGSQTYVYTEVDLKKFTVRWDEVTAQDLFIKFDVTSIDGITVPLDVKIADDLPATLLTTIGGSINTNDLVEAVKLIDPNSLVTGAGFSKTFGGAYTALLSPDTLGHRFTVATPNIAVTVI